MKAVILAGGLGTRISEESVLRPKPMIDIGDKPILWHIMKIYSAHGINDFILCLGYKGYVIKEYFANYFLHLSDVTFDLPSNTMSVHRNTVEPWRVTLVDTGPDTATGGRLKRVLPYIEEEQFCFTYGDGVANVNVRETVEVHRASGKLATVTTVRPPARFGSITIDGDNVTEFAEKPQIGEGWINGGFFVLNKAVGEYIENDLVAWEREPLERLSTARQLNAFRHNGFWHSMDTVRDRKLLEELWEGGAAPWKIW